MENLLKNKRLEKKMTLEQVGEIVGVGKSTVRKWENGMIENMGRDKIVALSKALDISPLDILGIPKDEEEKFNSAQKSQLDDLFDKLDEPRQENVINFTKIQLAEQNNDTSKSAISLRKYRDEQETSTLIVHGLESAGEGEWQEDDLDMEVQIPINEIPEEYDDLAMVLGDSMRPKLHNGDILFITFTKQIEIGEIGVFRTSRGNFVKKLKDGYLESLNPEYDDIYFCEDEECEAIGVVVDYYRK
ncbi:helix-turn-helix domain-containing protein [Lactococcus lactis]|uniref:helix-turn-helix domain-containing protein n=1 Tax=Lactococcus lactis TaxID=1358 RepID=UPI0024A8B2A4|nr:LexA family transcriptional regulator [Lactococcus lactis]